MRHADGRRGDAVSQYFGIGLHCPKNSLNVGHVLRAAGCFGASFVATTGNRYKRAPTDTQGIAKSLPLMQVEDLRSVVPFDCVPVAVDLVPGAQRLETYEHPKRAFYVFGPEDSTLGDKVLSWCRDVVVVPAGCLNLAAAVNVVAYDRVAKLIRSGLLDAAPGGSTRKLKEL
jgi:tRNA(Leu) C34 or U34 (ribose-2'-O)-methylase TrmL